jgi:glutathione-specific gamma-glutamylcyclotransferase
MSDRKTINYLDPTSSPFLQEPVPSDTSVHCGSPGRSRPPDLTGSGAHNSIKKTPHPNPAHQTAVEKQLLTRELIEAGGIDAMIAREAPAMRLLSDSERAASVRATLAARPWGDAWLFGYGSLIWNPTIHFVERRTARIEGWHRAFCLSALVGRGSTNNPGLVLGLDVGGGCTGVAFRIAEDLLETELALLWRREMLSGAYVPRWLDVLDEQGRCFGSAIAFTIDQTGHHYAGTLGPKEVIRRLATACGALGSAAEYLFRTCEALRAHGIPDQELEGLAARVEAEHGRLGQLPSMVRKCES